MLCIVGKMNDSTYVIVRIHIYMRYTYISFPRTNVVIKDKFKLPGIITCVLIYE